MRARVQKKEGRKEDRKEEERHYQGSKSWNNLSTIDMYYKKCWRKFRLKEIIPDENSDQPEKQRMLEMVNIVAN